MKTRWRWDHFLQGRWRICLPGFVRYYVVAEGWRFRWQRMDKVACTVIDSVRTYATPEGAKRAAKRDWERRER